MTPRTVKTPTTPRTPRVPVQRSESSYDPVKFLKQANTPQERKIGMLWKKKKTGGGPKDWHQCIFKLDKDRLNFANKAEKAESEYKTINLQDAMIYFPFDDDSKANEQNLYHGKAFCFEIQTSTRTYYLHSETLPNLIGWLEAIAKTGVVTFKSPATKGLDFIQDAAPNCPQIYGRHGYLDKRGAINKSFKNRFWRTAENQEGKPILCYFKGLEAIKPAGIIPLFRATCEMETKETHGIDLIVGMRRFKLRAPDALNRRRWVDTFEHLSIHGAVSSLMDTEDIEIDENELSRAKILGSTVYVLPSHTREAAVQVEIKVLKQQGLKAIVEVKGKRRKIGGTGWVLQWLNPYKQYRKSEVEKGVMCTCILSIGPHCFFRILPGHKRQFIQKRFKDQFKNKGHMSMSVFSSLDCPQADLVFASPKEKNLWQKIFEEIASNVSAMRTHRFSSADTAKPQLGAGAAAQPVPPSSPVPPLTTPSPTLDAMPPIGTPPETLTQAPDAIVPVPLQPYIPPTPPDEKPVQRFNTVRALNLDEHREHFVSGLLEADDVDPDDIDVSTRRASLAAYNVYTTKEVDGETVAMF